MVVPISNVIIQEVETGGSMQVLDQPGPRSEFQGPQDHISNSLYYYTTNSYNTNLSVPGPWVRAQEWFLSSGSHQAETKVAAGFMFSTSLPNCTIGQGGISGHLGWLPPGEDPGAHSKNKPLGLCCVETMMWPGTHPVGLCQVLGPPEGSLSGFPGVFNGTCSEMRG